MQGSARVEDVRFRIYDSGIADLKLSTETYISFTFLDVRL